VFEPERNQLFVEYDIIFSTSFEQQFPLADVAAEALASGAEFCNQAPCGRKIGYLTQVRQP
jgi:hypothetical protein